MQMDQLRSVTAPMGANGGFSQGNFGDALIEQGRIGSVDLRTGGYDFGDILDIVAHRLVAAGQDRAVLRLLRTMTVRQFLRERYGVSTGSGDDRRDLRRFRNWIMDARWLRRRKARAA